MASSSCCVEVPSGRVAIVSGFKCVSFVSCTVRIAKLQNAYWAPLASSLLHHCLSSAPYKISAIASNLMRQRIRLLQFQCEAGIFSRVWTPDRLLVRRGPGNFLTEKLPRESPNWHMSHVTWPKSISCSLFWRFKKPSFFQKRWSSKSKFFDFANCVGGQFIRLAGYSSSQNHDSFLFPRINSI